MSYTKVNHQLPALLPNQMALLKALEDDDISLSDLSKIILLDPVITSKLLRLSNSAFFGMPGKVIDLDEAILLVGTSTVREFTLSQILMSYSSIEPWRQLDLGEFWKQALKVAVCCKVIAGKTLLSPNRAFSVGFMHSLGVLELLAFNSPAHIEWLRSGIYGEQLAKLERANLFTDHAETGADLLRSWNLPPAVYQAVGQQYELPDSEQIDMLAEVLKFAHVMNALAFDESSVESNLIFPISEDVYSLFELDATQIPTMTSTIKAKYGKLEHILEY